MNILPKKKWHVRTKENMARVRRDEAKAAEEAKAVAKRAALAENEDRVRRLKSKRVDSASFGYGDREAPTTSTTTFALIDGRPEATNGHINLFAELEEQERSNLQEGNKEYEKQKKQEHNDWESKMGIMKRFAEDTKEYSKEKNWWETIPLNREEINQPQITSKPIISSEKSTRKSNEKISTESTSKTNKKHKRSRSNSPSTHSSKSRRKRKKHSGKDISKLEKLRAERILREEQEKRRAEALLNPKKEPRGNVSELEKERSRKYNTQFNPELAKW